MPFKETGRGLAWIVGSALLIAFGVNSFHPRGIALVGQWNPAHGVVTAKSKTDVVDQHIEIDSVQDAKKIFDAGAVFVDARPISVFAEGHVQGAYCIPAYEAEAHLMDFLETVAPDTPVVTYCSGRSCEDSHLLAALMKDLGYRNVRVFIDGYSAWQAAGYPIGP